MGTEQLNEVREYEKRRGISYAVEGGKLYKYLVFFGFTAFAYALIMVSFYILGTFFLQSEVEKLWNNGFITIIGSTVIALFTPIVFFALRLKVTALITGVCSNFVLAASFIRISTVDGSVSTPGSTITKYDAGFFGLKKMFYWRHGIPMAIVIVVFTWLAVIIIRERKIIRSEFEKIQNNKYRSQITE